MADTMNSRKKLLSMQKFLVLLLSNLSDKNPTEQLANLVAIYDIMQTPEYEEIKDMISRGLLVGIIPILSERLILEDSCDCSEIFDKIAFMSLNVLQLMCDSGSEAKSLIEERHPILNKCLLSLINPKGQFFHFGADFDEKLREKTLGIKLTVSLRTAHLINCLNALIKKTTRFDAGQVNTSGLIYECVIFTDCDNRPNCDLITDLCSSGCVWPDMRHRDLDRNDKQTALTVTNVIGKGLFYAYIGKDIHTLEKMKEILQHPVLGKPLTKLPTNGEYLIASVFTNGFSETLHRVRVLCAYSDRLVNIFCIDTGHLVTGVKLEKLRPMYHAASVSVVQPKLNMFVLSGIQAKPGNTEVCQAALSCLCDMTINNQDVGDCITSQSNELQDLLPLLLSPDWLISVNAPRLLGNVLSASAKARTINLTQVIRVVTESLKRFETSDHQITPDDARFIEARVYLLHRCLLQGSHVKHSFMENNGLRVVMGIYKLLYNDPENHPVFDKLCELICVYVGDGTKLAVEVWDRKENGEIEDAKKKQAHGLMYRKTNNTQFYPHRQQNTRNNGKPWRLRADDRISEKKSTSETVSMWSDTFLERADKRNMDLQQDKACENTIKSLSSSRNEDDEKTMRMKQNTTLEGGTKNGFMSDRSGEDSFLVARIPSKDFGEKSEEKMYDLSISKSFLMENCTAISAKDSSHVKVMDGNVFIEDLPQMDLLSDVGTMHDQHNHFMPNRNMHKMTQTSMKKLTCGILNGGGGRIYFGISAEGKVEGVLLDRDKRDSLRIGFDHLMSDCFQPKLLPMQFSLVMYAVVTTEDKRPLKDLYVVEVTISALKDMFYSLDDQKSCYRRGSSTVEFKSQDVRMFVAQRENKTQLRKIGELQKVIDAAEVSFTNV